MATTMSRSEYPPRSHSRSPPTYSRRRDTHDSHYQDRYQPSRRRDRSSDYSSRSRSPPPRQHHSDRRRSRDRSPDYHRRRRSYSRSPRRREDGEDPYARSPSPRRPYRSPSPDRQHRRSPSPEIRHYRSPSPYSKRRRSYSHSRSPPPRSKELSKKSTGGGGGFKWKAPSSNPPNEANGAAEKKGMDRGYSSHYTQPRPKSRSPERDDLTSKFGSGYSERYSRPTKRPASPTSDPGIAAKFGTASAANTPDDDERRRRKREKKAQKTREGPKPVDGPMIVVNVNDRLGTKVAVPCLASDPIRLFKAQVAARVGRQPHEIMLKRQGERPFKDQLTLEDYGVSNGVQLDLEVDTGE